MPRPCPSHCLCLLLLLSLLLAAEPSSPETRKPETPKPETLKFGSRPQLLVDDRLIDRQSDLVRLPVLPVKADQGRPIVENARLYGTVLHDGIRFRLWARNPDQGYHYAESGDGLHFQRIGEITGIPFAGDYTLAVEFDRPALDGSRRLMASFDAPGMAAGIATSQDGLRWSPLNNGQPVTARAADTYNQILWDPTARTYRLLTRTDYAGGGGAGELRGHRTMTNKDPWRHPKNWKTVGEWNLDRTGKRRQIYAATHWIYEGSHFALLSVYEWPGDLSEGPADLHKRHERDVMNTYLVTSHDGTHWNMDPVERNLPFLPRGPDGAFDKALLFPASTIVTHDGKHWLYYCGANERHGTPDTSFPRTMHIGLATFPQNRLYALAAPQGIGSFTTKPFLYESGTLTCNVDATAGSLRLELLNEEGTPISNPSGPLIADISHADHTAFPLDWNSTKNTAGKNLTGQTVRLRATLNQARLYSFQFTNTP